MNFGFLIKILLLVGVLATAKSDTQPKNSNTNNNNNNNNINNNNNNSPETQSGFTPLSAPIPSALDKSNSKLYENAAFDPSLYETYVPQDAVQQYVSTYGGPYPPTAYSAGFDHDNNGYRVENGFEGYLVPQFADGSGTYANLDDYVNLQHGLVPILGPQKGADTKLVPALKTVLAPFGLEWLISLIPASVFAVIPIIFGAIVKIGSVVIGAAAVAGIGGLILHLICSITSICSVTLHKVALPFLKWTEGVKSNVQNKIAHTIEAVAETVDNVNHHFEHASNSAENTIHSKIDDVAAKVANKVAEAQVEAEAEDVVSDRIKRATEFVKSAIKKYEELQKKGEIESIEQIIDHIAE